MKILYVLIKSKTFIYSNILLAFLIFAISNSSAQLPAFEQPSVDRMIVVYNNNDSDDNNNGIPDSKELALYYQNKRHISDANMLGLDISTKNYYYKADEWENFWDEVVTPIKEKISELGDENIYYILLCDKMPYQVSLPKTAVANDGTTSRSLDNTLAAMNIIGTKEQIQTFPQYWYINPVYETTPSKYSDKGQFTHNYKLGWSNLYLVSRLISKNITINKNLIDMALYGEKYLSLQDGYYQGTGYADNRFGEYDDSTLDAGYRYVKSYAEFDKDAAYIRFFYRASGVTYKQESTEKEIGEEGAIFTDGSSATFASNAMIYGGWYNYNKYQDAWDWMPGSFACDLNSNSGAKMRDGKQTFLSSSFAKGLTCGSGCIGEPYLTGHSQPDIFLYYFLNGYNFIESAFHSEPGLCWKGITIGDPLYNPYRKDKIPVKDTTVQVTQISYDFISSTQTNILIDYSTSIERPEVVKATLYWGTSTDYSDTIKSHYGEYTNPYFAHHKFELSDLDSNTSYHFKVHVIDPVGNTWDSKDITFSTDGESDLVNADFICERETLFVNDTINFINLSSGNNSYIWKKDGELLGTQKNAKTTFSSEGQHTISLIADNGVYVDSIMKTYTLEISGIAEPLSTKSFNIYPNPFFDYAIIKYSINNIANTSLEICNIFGVNIKTLFKGQQNRGTYSYSFNSTQLNLASGIYFVNLNIGGKIYSKPIIKVE